MSILNKPFFCDEAAAYAKLESIVWPNGSVCVHCGGSDRIGLLKGKATRPGIYKCYACRKQFRVTVGTVFEASHIPLHQWLQAVYLVVSSKKGISSNQIALTMGITVKSAWFMTHRIREAMKGPQWPDCGKLGGGGLAVEAGETFVVGKAENRTYGPIPPIRLFSPWLGATEPCPQLPCSKCHCGQSGSDCRSACSFRQPVHDGRSGHLHPYGRWFIGHRL